MPHDFTLPRLQSMLDNLSEGQKVTLARKEVDRLFGFNDVGATRVARFAESHDCIIAHADACVVFEKRFRS